MPKQRLVVSGTGLRPVQRTPSVRVRDNYVPGAAARGASADLEQLAEGFGRFAPALGQLAVGLQEKKRQEGIAAGRARFAELAQQQEDFGEAMRLGLIEARDNPFFRAGMLEAAGQVAGDRYGDALRTATSEITDKADIGAFDRARMQVYNDFVGALGPMAKNELFDAAFQARAQGHSQSQRSAFAGQVSPHMLSQRLDLLYSQAAESLTLVTTGEASVEAVAAAITQYGDEAYLQGIEGSVINDTLARALTQTAIGWADDDPAAADELLEIAEQILTGPRKADGRRASLFATRQGRGLLGQAEDAIAGINQRNNRYFQWERQVERDAAAEEVYVNYAAALAEAENPARVDIRQYQNDLIAAGDYNGAARLNAIREAHTQGRWSTDEAVKSRLFQRIHLEGDVSTAEIMDQVAAMRLTVVDANFLLGERDALIAAAQTGDNPMRDPIYTRALDGINPAFKDQFDVMGGARGEQVNRAKAALSSAYARLLESGQWQTMSYSERVNWMREAQSEVIRLYGGGDADTDEAFGGEARLGDPTADWRSVVVITEAQLNRLERTMDRDNPQPLSPEDDALLDALGIADDSLGTFVATQRSLYTTQITEF